MTTSSIKIRRLIGLFLLGVILFNYPILSLFSHPVMFLGFPLLYFYLFAVWIVFILLIAKLSSKKQKYSEAPFIGMETDLQKK